MLFLSPVSPPSFIRLQVGERLAKRIDGPRQMSNSNSRLRREEREKEKIVANSYRRRTRDAGEPELGLFKGSSLYCAKKGAGTADQEAREYREAFTINKAKEEAEDKCEITSDNGPCSASSEKSTRIY
jgi:hypothetical protein